MSSGVQSCNHVQAAVDGYTTRDESNICGKEKMTALIELNPCHRRGMLAERTKVTPNRNPVLDVPMPANRIDKLDQACNLGPNNEHGCPDIARGYSLGQGVTIHFIGELPTYRPWKGYCD